MVDPRTKADTMPDPRGRSLFPEATCAAPTRLAKDGPSPRCVVAFDRPLAAIGLAPGGALAITALAHAATVGWHLPAASVGLLFDPLPATAEARVILVDDASSSALFTVDSQIWRFDTRTGGVEERIDGPGGMIDDLAWAKDGSLVASIGAGDGQAVLLAGLGGGAPAAEGRRLSTDARAVHVALDTNGKYAAVATETGEIGIFDLASSEPPRVARPSSQPAGAIAFAANHLFVAGSDGVLRAFDARSAVAAARIDVGSPLVQVAVSADGECLATADRDRVVRLHAVPSGEVAGKLAWHEATVSALGFGAGPTLVSADNDSQVAVWDLDPGRECRVR